MTSDKPSLYYVFQSRKFWSAVVGFVAIIYVAWHSGAALDPDTVVNAILGIVAAYMGATALEDGMTNRNANKTTIETPSQNVEVSTSDAPAKPPTPPVGRMGL